MNELSFEQMETIEGGWSFTGCVLGAGVTIESGLAEYAGAVTGGWGFFGVLAVGCLIGAYAH